MKVWILICRTCEQIFAQPSDGLGHALKTGHVEQDLTERK